MSLGCSGFDTRRSTCPGVSCGGGVVTHIGLYTLTLPGGLRLGRDLGSELRVKNLGDLSPSRSDRPEDRVRGLVELFESSTVLGPGPLHSPDDRPYLVPVTRPQTSPLSFPRHLFVLVKTLRGKNNPDERVRWVRPEVLGLRLTRSGSREDIIPYLPTQLTL